MKEERRFPASFASAPTAFNLSQSNSSILLAQRDTTDGVVSAQNQRARGTRAELKHVFLLTRDSFHNDCFICAKFMQITCGTFSCEIMRVDERGIC